MPDAILRFAPSPNGRLHLGHAYSALLNDAVARRLGGTWLLRIEDIDPSRSTPGNIAAAEADLAWLGLSWPRPVRQQSAHLAEYVAAADRLRAAGLLFPCFCTRGDIAAAVAEREPRGGATWPRDPDGSPLYPGTCRHLAPPDVGRRIGTGDPHSWRLDTAAAVATQSGVAWRRFEPDGGASSTVEAHPERWGDVVLVRKDVPTSYHLSVVIDDAAQGITHVVRGLDIEPATDLHALLAAILGLPAPHYHHHALITDPTGHKLAKSRRSQSLADLREAGDNAEAIRRRLGFG